MSLKPTSIAPESEDGLPSDGKLTGREPLQRNKPLTESVAVADGDGALSEALACLRVLLDRDEIRPARALLEQMALRWPDAERVRHFMHVLAPPVARARPDLHRRVHHREREWVREHAATHPGCWLAVVDERLVAADPSLRVVLARLTECPDAADALLHFQPGTTP